MPVVQVDDIFFKKPVEKKEKKYNSPFHVTTLGSPKCKNVIFREQIQTHRINAFLVDDDKVLFLLFRVDGLIAYEVLEFDNLFDLGICKPSLGFYQFLPLFRRRIEEARVYLTGIQQLDQTIEKA